MKFWDRTFFAVCVVLCCCIWVAGRLGFCERVEPVGVIIV